MVRSMTGFGRCRINDGKYDITVEIRSVNSRFFDCTAKISRAFAFLEEKVKPFLQSHGVTRGKVDVWIGMEKIAGSSDVVSIDRSFLEEYLKALAVLKNEYGLKDDISVMTVAQKPEVFSVQKAEEDVDADWQALLPVLTDATQKFLAAREAEGRALEADLLGKLDDVEKAVAVIEVLSEKDVATYRERLAERIREALADNQIQPDEARLLTECAIHADKVAVDEELVRLRTHLASFREILAGKEPVGRRLDFLLQEMNREINTTGSKCANAEIAGYVVNVKCELEKIREQIQNLE